MFDRNGTLIASLFNMFFFLSFFFFSFLRLSYVDMFSSLGRGGLEWRISHCEGKDLM